MKLQIKLIILITIFSFMLSSSEIERDLLTIKKDEIKESKIDCKY